LRERQGGREGGRAKGREGEIYRYRARTREREREREKEKERKRWNLRFNALRIQYGKGDVWLKIHVCQERYLTPQSCPSWWQKE